MRREKKTVYGGDFFFFFSLLRASLSELEWPFHLKKTTQELFIMKTLEEDAWVLKSRVCEAAKSKLRVLISLHGIYFPAVAFSVT